MKLDSNQPEDIGRMAQNFEHMHRQDRLDQIARRAVWLGLFLFGAASAVILYAVFGGL